MSWSRLRYPKPAGRITRLAFPRRLNPERPVEWPYDVVVAAAAPWPAGKAWKKRRAMAAPVRAVAGLIAEVAQRLNAPLHRLATLIEGQPLVWECEMVGWRERFRSGRLIWVYEGEITPAIRQMFAEHPERFEHCAPALLSTLRLGR